MKGMLIKDFKLLKGQKQYFIIVCLFAVIFMFFSNQYYFGIGYTLVMFISFTLNSIAYDEYDNGYPFLFTLPISRKNYVREKYFFGFLSSFIGCVINLVLIAVLQIVKSESDVDVQIMLLTMAGALAGGMLMMSVVLPMQFKFGSEKRQLALIVGFVIFFAVLYLGKRAVEQFGIPNFMKQLGNLSMGAAVGMIAVLVIALTVVSYLISVRIMEKKEM